MSKSLKIHDQVVRTGTTEPVMCIQRMVSDEGAFCDWAVSDTEIKTGTFNINDLSPVKKPTTKKKTTK